MVATKQRVRGFGGFQVLENRPADDLLFGRLIAEQGVKVKLLNYAVETVPDFQGVGELLAKRLRWMTVMRAMRPWGHFGLLFTWGLPWTTLDLLGTVPDVSPRHHLAHRDPRIKTTATLDKNATDSALGCCGVFNLAGELHAYINSLAQHRLSAPEWPICCRHRNPGARFFRKERFVEEPDAGY
jgi:hypothetical protein